MPAHVALTNQIGGHVVMPARRKRWSRRGLAAAVAVVVAALGVGTAGSARADSGGDRLLAGQSLVAGESIQSPNGAFRLVVQTDGNAVEYQGSRVVWTAGTRGVDPRLVVQADGNLVLYADGAAAFATTTAGADAFLVLQDDGNVVLYSSGHALWSGATGRLLLPIPIWDPIVGPGCLIHANQQLVSPSGRYQLVVQGDGNVVEYQGSTVVWATRTNGVDPVLTLQSDGNLVVYLGGVARFSTSTSTTSGGTRLILALQDDGNLVIYDSGRALWSRRTGALGR